ncbi:TetR/AcrR family transcriptional regulator [Nocardia asteroides]|uniref:TetR/AcrR family transcriptional regulator n=1 Tax=Nocardia asteroides TaxID=1824 RepID=UPI001E353202|nr:TetR/AcrR family transcriptional regulator [Nocardia asteroides]UGT55144.1 TetR/AcrR family transcriptional regulator [Nocardia asteroides]
MDLATGFAAEQEESTMIVSSANQTEAVWTGPERQPPAFAERVLNRREATNRTVVRDQNLMTAEPVDYRRWPIHPSQDATAIRARREFRRQCAIDAATQVFGARGYHAATMDDIAKRAGYSKPTLYTEFTGKLELYLTVLQQQIDTLTNNLHSALTIAAPNGQRVHAAVEAYFDFVDHKTQGFRLIFETDASGEPAVQLRISRAVESCIDVITVAIEHDTSLGPQRARILAAGLVGASQFAAQYWLDTGRSINKNDAVDAVIALCWGGLSSVPRRAVTPMPNPSPPAPRTLEPSTPRT